MLYEIKMNGKTVFIAKTRNEQSAFIKQYGLTVERLNGFTLHIAYSDNVPVNDLWALNFYR